MRTVVYWICWPVISAYIYIKNVIVYYNAPESETDGESESDVEIQTPKKGESKTKAEAAPETNSQDQCESERPITGR